MFFSTLLFVLKVVELVLDKGIKGKLVNVIISMYSKLKAHVKLDNNGNLVNDVNVTDNVMRNPVYVPDAFNYNIGTRQGYMYSPMLFNLFIDNLRKYLKDNCNQSI